MHASTDFDADQYNNSRDLSKEKFSVDVSAIEGTPSKMQQNTTYNTLRSRHENDAAIKEMSHFGGSLASHSIYSTQPGPENSNGAQQV